jgi:hypothetical protein
MSPQHYFVKKGKGKKAHLIYPENLCFYFGISLMAKHGLIQKEIRTDRKGRADSTGRTGRTSRTEYIRAVRIFFAAHSFIML